MKSKRWSEGTNRNTITYPSDLIRVKIYGSTISMSYPDVVTHA